MSVVKRSPDHARIVRVLLALAAAGLIASAIVYNEVLLAALDPAPPLRPDTVLAVRLTQVGFLVAGIALAIVAGAVTRFPVVARFARHPLLPRGIVAAIVVLPLAIGECALRPFTPLGRPMTTIFARDAELGWRMRPGAEGLWGEAVVRVNAKGLRGPDLDYRKPAGEDRILFLGDSVTFGYGLPDAEDAYPFRTATRLAADSNSHVVAINAGVGGYSPWQERLYLQSEGMRYDPDVVVVGLVLNDVTEKLGLRQFGGTGEGFQLEHSVFGLLDRLSIHSALFYQLRAAKRRQRFGDDVAAGAVRRELLDVRTLVDEPHRRDVEQAWAITLEQVGAIAGFCRDRRVPILLVVFPYAFQFDDPKALSAPQRRLRAFAAAEGVPLLDLLPPLAARLAATGETAEKYFLDRNHLSAAGSQAVAELIADEIRQRDWLAGPSAR